MAMSSIAYSAAPARAATWCKEYGLLLSLEGAQGVETFDCLTYTSDRGFRGQVDWYTYTTNNFQVIGSYHVELKRNGNHLANSDEWTNPYVHACINPLCTSPDVLATNNVQKPKSGTFCVILWEARTSASWANIEEGCHTF